MGNTLSLMLCTCVIEVQHHIHTELLRLARDRWHTHSQMECAGTLTSSLRAAPSAPSRVVDDNDNDDNGDNGDDSDDFAGDAVSGEGEEQDMQVEEEKETEEVGANTFADPLDVEEKVNKERRPTAKHLYFAEGEQRLHAALSDAHNTLNAPSANTLPTSSVDEMYHALAHYAAKLRTVKE